MFSHVDPPVTAPAAAEGGGALTFSSDGGGAFTSVYAGGTFTVTGATVSGAFLLSAGGGAFIMVGATTMTSVGLDFDLVAVTPPPPAPLTAVELDLDSVIAAGGTSRGGDRTLLRRGGCIGGGLVPSRPENKTTCAWAIFVHLLAC